MALSWKQWIVLLTLMALMTGGTFTCHSSSDDDDNSVHIHN
jgi:hypothetical protein